MASENTIEIETRLGRRAIDPEKIIEFPRGLAGFEEERQFTLLPLRPDAPLLILQSMTRPEVGLLVADPYSFLPSYPVVINDAEQKLLKLEGTDESAILVTVSIPEGQPENAMLNLTGPIVINQHLKIGIQIPQGFEGPAQISMHEAAEQAHKEKCE